MLGEQRLSTRAVVSLAALSLIVAYSQISIWAGHRNFRNAGVGGISIDAEGVLRQADPASKKMGLMHTALGNGIADFLTGKKGLD